VHVDPIKSTLKAPVIKRLKLKYDKLLSSFGFKFNLRRYTMAQSAAAATAVAAAAGEHQRECAAVGDDRDADDAEEEEEEEEKGPAVAATAAAATAAAAVSKIPEVLQRLGLGGFGHLLGMCDLNQYSLKIDVPMRNVCRRLLWVDEHEVEPRHMMMFNSRVEGMNVVDAVQLNTCGG